MTSSEKVSQLRSKQPKGRFVRVESSQGGKVVVSDVFDLERVTIRSAEKDVCRRTLALVSGQFTLVVADVAEPVQVEGCIVPLPLEH